MRFLFCFVFNHKPQYRKWIVDGKTVDKIRMHGNNIAWRINDELKN